MSSDDAAIRRRADDVIRKHTQNQRTASGAGHVAQQLEQLAKKRTDKDGKPDAASPIRSFSLSIASDEELDRIDEDGFIGDRGSNPGPEDGHEEAELETMPSLRVQGSFEASTSAAGDVNSSPRAGPTPPRPRPLFSFDPESPPPRAPGEEARGFRSGNQSARSNVTTARDATRFRTPPRLERLYEDGKSKQKDRKALEEEAQKRISKECTFRPSLHRPRPEPRSVYSAAHNHDGQSIYQRTGLWKQQVELKRESVLKEREDRERREAQEGLKKYKQETEAFRRLISRARNQPHIRFGAGEGLVVGSGSAANGTAGGSAAPSTAGGDEGGAAAAAWAAAALYPPPRRKSFFKPMPGLEPETVPDVDDAPNYSSPIRGVVAGPTGGEGAAAPGPLPLPPSSGAVEILPSGAPGPVSHPPHNQHPRGTTPRSARRLGNTNTNTNANTSGGSNRDSFAARARSTTPSRARSPLDTGRTTLVERAVEVEQRSVEQFLHRQEKARAFKEETVRLLTSQGSKWKNEPTKAVMPQLGPANRPKVRPELRALDRPVTRDVLVKRLGAPQGTDSPQEGSEGFGGGGGGYGSAKDSARGAAPGSTARSTDPSSLAPGGAGGAAPASVTTPPAPAPTTSPAVRDSWQSAEPDRGEGSQNTRYATKTFYASADVGLGDSVSDFEGGATPGAAGGGAAPFDRSAGSVEFGYDFDLEALAAADVGRSRPKATEISPGI